ncbi:predicted protein, partial [Nematostella vectensis]
LVFYSVCLCVSAFGVIGNGCVIWLITTRPSLRNTTNRLILSLSVADFLVSLCMAPASMTCHFLQCNQVFLGIVHEMMLYWSVNNLCGVTIERYISICHPLKYPILMAKSRSLILIAGCWLIPLV